MANPLLQPLIKLDMAAAKCRNQGKVCLWHTDGLPINIVFTIPKGAIVAQTLVLVDKNDSCLLMIMCISPTTSKTTIIAAGDFSSLNDLKAHHPKLFEVMGTLKQI